MPTIHTLRVHKKTAGRDFPFDRVYLCTLESQPLLERMFRYALVLPVHGPLKTMLEKVAVDTFKEVLPNQYKAGEENERDVSGSVLEILKSTQDLLCVIPIRGTVYSKEILPNYITHKSWLSTRRRRSKHVAETPFTQYSYLLTPRDKIQPICVACPNLINHENGDCELGDSVCLENLPLGLENHFEKAAAIPDGENVLEKDVTPPPSTKI